MVKELTLRIDISSQDEQIAIEILEELRKGLLYSPDNMYRGVNTTLSRLDLIRKTGTDRCSAIHRVAALRELSKMEKDYEDVTMKDALLATDPGYVWLNREPNLDESVKWARKGEAGQPIVLVFSGEIKLNQPRGLYIDYYRFNKPALSYLNAIVFLERS